MLTELKIRNFAIIPELELQFGPGLTVFTGETGAGKSIILDALSLVLGAKADPEMIRKGAERAIIEASFSLSPAAQVQIEPLLDAEGLLDEPGFLSLSREIRAEGRSIARVNGRSVAASLQSEIAEFLVDVHGQSEHLSLLKVRNHLKLLDRMAHNEAALKTYQEAYSQFQNLKKQLLGLQTQQENADKALEMLQFQVKEIEEARLKAGEEEELRTERSRLANAETLSKLSAEALAALDDATPETPSATDLLGSSSHRLMELSHIDSSMAGLAERIETALTQVSDAAYELRNYLDSIEFNPKRLDQIEERLNLLSNLKRKYGSSTEAVLEHLANKKLELEQVSNIDDQILELNDSIVEIRNALAESAALLSEKRGLAAEQLSKAVEAALAQLQMNKARFLVEAGREEAADGLAMPATGIWPAGSYSFDSSGVDLVEFLVETNPGEGMKPMAKTASGGETSRLMLAMKNALAEADQIPTLVFDEIDQGIGGRVGMTVGEMLWQLGRDHQVLCVTHLTQLAAFGDQHYSVSKAEADGRTSTTLRQLTGEARNEELAVMMGRLNQANLNSVSELLTTIQEIKGKI